MKKNGFTLLELLIGISLISGIMVFLFRLIHDIQNESLSNTYISSNQTNRNEIISIVASAMHENENLCSLETTKESNQTTLRFGFCNNINLTLSVSQRQVHITYKSNEYNYIMKDETAYYDPKVETSTFSMSGFHFLKINIKTHKKGLKSTTIDDIEIIGRNTKQISTSTINGNKADFFGDGSTHYYRASSTGDYRIELWASASFIPSGAKNSGYYVSGTVHLNEGERLLIYPGPKPIFEYCSAQNQTCTVSTPKIVYYGVDTRWNSNQVHDSISCNDSTFGDPARDVAKSCYSADAYQDSTVLFTNSLNSVPDSSETTLLIKSSYESVSVDNTMLTDTLVMCSGCSTSQEGDPVAITPTTCESENHQTACANLGSGFARVTKLS